MRGALPLCLLCFAALGAEPGVLVEQPKDGEKLEGKWVAVSGTFDPARYRFIAVVGATETPDAMQFYAPTGHVGIPTVPVWHGEGRFFAPRVPLNEGATEIHILAFSARPEAQMQADDIVIKVTGSRISVEPIAVTAKLSGENPPATATLSATAPGTAEDWEWDLDGDGTFEAKGREQRRAYGAGDHAALARARAGGRWVYGLTQFLVSVPSTVHETAVIGAPRAIAVIPHRSLPLWFNPPDAYALTRYVLVAEKNQVVVFDARLKKLGVLSGLVDPTGMTADERGRVYVAETGKNRVVRFTAFPNPKLDRTWADGGSYTGPPGEALRRPVSISYDRNLRWAEDGGTEFDDRWSMEVLEEEGRAVTFDAELDRWQAQAFPYQRLDSKLPPRDFYRPTGPTGEPESNTWFSSGGKLYRPHHTEPAPQVNGLRGYTASDHYWAVLDSERTLHEWYAWGSLRHRTTRLTFDARVLAIDAGGTAYLKKKHNEGRGRDRYGHFGPAVLYLAGPGRIERRVVPVFEQGR